MRNFSAPLSIYFFPALTWASLIVFMSLLPGKELKVFTFFQSDKLLHIVAYTALSYLIYLGGKYSRIMESKSFIHLFNTLLLCTFFGICIELMQYKFVTDRFFDIFDILANGIGTILGLFTVIKVKNI